MSHVMDSFPLVSAGPIQNAMAHRRRAVACYDVSRHQYRCAIGCTYELLSILDPTIYG